MEQERVFYFVDVDYNGISRTYSSPAVAKREAHKFAKKLSCCMSVTADVTEFVIYKNNGRMTSKKTLIASYTY